MQKKLSMLALIVLLVFQTMLAPIAATAQTVEQDVSGAETSEELNDAADVSKENEGLEDEEIKVGEDESTENGSSGGENEEGTHDDATEEDTETDEVVAEDDTNEDESEEATEEDKEVKETSEVMSENEVEKSPIKKQAIETYAELGNIFEFDFFQLAGGDVENGAEIVFDTEYQLQYKWDTKEREVKAGDTARLKLPDVFKEWPENTPAQPIRAHDGTEVGMYTISGGELVFEFNENIEDGDVHNGYVGFNVTFDNEKFLEEWEQDIDFDGDGVKDLTVVAKPNEVDNKLEKEGQADQFTNAREITWSVDITNGNEEAITNGVLKDILPDGVGEPRDFVVREFTYDFEGNKVPGEPVSFNDPIINGNEFELNFDNVPARGGYTVEYTTTITDRTATEFTNDATFTAEDVNLDAKKTVEIGERSNPIQKSGSYNWGTGQIDWTIIVNENGEEIDHAIVHDTLPPGLTIKGSIDVTKNGQAVDNVETTDFPMEPIELGQVSADEVYRITFSTEIDWSQVNEGEYQQNNAFTNRTELTDGEDPLGEDDAPVDVWREHLLTKSGNANGYTYEDKVLTWTIDVNKAKHPISNAVVTDILPAGLDIEEADIVITNEAGDPVSADDILITSLDDGRTEVTIDLGDIGTETRKITYTTEVTDFKVDNFTNEATLEGDGIGENTPGDKEEVNPPGNSYEKDFKSIDYNAKTIDWSIKVDPKREPITALEITDTFPTKGLILLPESVVVKMGDTVLSSDDYTLVPNTEGEETGYNKGFTITLNNISEDTPLNQVITVDFTTSYDPQLEVDGNTIDDHVGDPTRYVNRAGFTGKTVNDNDINEEDEADTNVRQDSWNSGKKEGQLVHFDEEGNKVEGWESGYERKIAWQVYTNYQKQNLGTGVVITDTLDYEGTIDEDSITVSVYEVSTDGETTITDETITNYEISVDGKEFTLTFGEDFVVDERYVVTFTTTVPDISQGKYTNNASVKVGDKEYPYPETVNYDEWNDYLDKQALGQEGNEVFIGEELEWEVSVNESLSIIKNATIKDTISAGLAYVEDSLVITTSGDAELVKGEDYTLEVTTTEDGETVLDITFEEDVTEALTLNYTTVVIAENGQQVNNKVELNGDGVENQSKETDSLTAKQFSWVGGEYNPRRGVIVVEKVDSDGNVIETGEATFELYFEMNDERILVGEYLTTNGILEIPNLPLRTYYLVEVAAPDGYVITDQEIEVVVDKAYGSNEVVFDVTVTNYKENEEPELVEVTVEKVWEDAENQAGFRPESITINLLANGEEIDSTELNADNEWLASFTELPAVDGDGNDIEYTVEEVEVPNYTSEVTADEENENKFIVKNTHEPELIDVEGTKTWDDADNQDGKRPDSIIVRLLANGEEVDFVEVTAETDWTFEFTDLPRFENGVEITYTIQEDGVEDYSTEIDGFDITNSYTPEQTSINVVKAWEDANNQDGNRPASITVKLLANGEETGKEEVLNANNNWQADFTELDVYANGEEIVYTVEEVEVEGYVTVISGTPEDGYAITNNYTPEVVDVEGTKTWDDANNQDGKRPELITVRLLANGTEVDSIEVTKENEWKYSFIDLPKFENGEEITYTVQENQVEDYSTEIDGFNITNSYTPGKTSVNVLKVWEDAENQNDKRPESIEVVLLADGEATDQTLVLNETNNWQDDFSELDEYKDGQQIKYTVEEVAVDEYRTEITGDAETGFVITNTQKTYAIGDYTWIDSNKDGIQEDEEVLEGVKVELFDEEGNKIAETETDENGLYLFDELPAGNYKVKFTLTEEQAEKYVFTKQNADENSTKDSDADPETGWTKVIELNDENEHLTKDYTDQDFEATEGIDPTWDAGVIEKTPITPIEPAKTKVSVEKVWKGEAQDSVTINLLADGEKVDSVELSEENDWKHTFTELPTVHDITDEKAIEYTVEEVAVEGYRVSVTGDAKEGFIITNTQKTYAVGDYTWIDSNKDGIQDEDEEVLPGVKVELFDEDGNKLAETETDENGFYIFDELPAGKYKIKFTLTEEQAKKYEFTKQNAGDDSTVDSDADENGWTIEFTLDDENEYLTKDYTNQDFKATEGIDPTWDAGVIEKVITEDPEDPKEPEEPQVPADPKDPEDPEKPTPEEPGEDKDPEDPKVGDAEGELPKTATNIYNLTLIGFGLMLLGMILFIVRRKRVE